MQQSIPEPWLRGALTDVHPILMPVLHALVQAKEDLHKCTDGLHENKIWVNPSDVTSLGFHLRHIAGSLDRLTTYMEGRALHEDQLAFLRDELLPGASLCTLLDEVDTAIETTSDAIRSLDATRLTDARSVGRKQLPTTVIGLAIHIAEHTQRHVGQAITTCLLLKSV